MKDAERIYALYVQANPVPDPDVLPLTREEVVLLPIERSPDMITQEQVEEPRAPQAPRRRGIATAMGATALVAAVALVAFLMLNNGEAGPVAAAEAAPVVTFDGTACNYDGPTLIGEGFIEFSLVNSANEGFTAAGWLMEEPALSAELQRSPIGTDMDAIDQPLPDGISAFGWQTDAGDSRTAGWPLAPGTYLIDCGVGSSPTTHVWRAAQIEVVAP